MGIAALVIGIVSLVVAFIPFCGMIAFLPAILGLILGLVDVILKTKKEAPKGQGIAGIVLNAIALVIIIFQTVVIGAAAVASEESLNELATEIETLEYE